MAMQDPVPASEPRRGLGARLVGLVLVALGFGLIAMVFAANYGGSRPLEALAFGLGLAYAPMLAAIGLCLVLVGLFALVRRRV